MFVTKPSLNICIRVKEIMVATRYEAELNQLSVLDLFYLNILRYSHRVLVLTKLNFTNVNKIKYTILNGTN